MRDEKIVSRLTCKVESTPLCLLDQRVCCCPTKKGYSTYFFRSPAKNVYELNQYYQRGFSVDELFGGGTDNDLVDDACC